MQGRAPFEVRGYLRSFAFRITVNAVAILVLNHQMTAALTALGTFDLTISREASANRDAAVFTLADYVLAESGIIVTLAGLMAVTVIAVLAVLGSFRILAREARALFRLRLFLYTLAHLLLSLALTAYLLICVAVLEQTNSIRLNETLSFVWAYPTYAIVALIYVAELYGFLTANGDALRAKPAPP